MTFPALPDTKSVMQPILNSKAEQYRWTENWATIPHSPAESLNGRTHGAAVSKSGLIYIFHQAVPGVLVYSPEGILQSSWGEFPGAHGLTLVEKNGIEFLWLTDQARVVVQKFTLDGTLVQEISKPPYASDPKVPYIPTWVAVNEIRHGGNGDIWVADGYGSHRVSRYDVKGNFIQTIDGSAGSGPFNCPHGIAFDARKSNPELYVADRGNHRVQVFDAEGTHKRTFGAEFLSSPDCFAFFHDQLVIPELQGRITLVDAQDRLVDYLGNHEAVASHKGWPDQTTLEAGKFNSPHGAATDAKGNIFIVEWRVGGRIIKLEKLS